MSKLSISMFLLLTKSEIVLYEYRIIPEGSVFPFNEGQFFKCDLRPHVSHFVFIALLCNLSKIQNTIYYSQDMNLALLDCISIIGLWQDLSLQMSLTKFV